MRFATVFFNSSHEGHIEGWHGSRERPTQDKMMNNKYRPWKTNEIRIVKDLRNTHTCEQIGKILGRSSASVWKKCSDLGLTIPHEPRKKWSEEEDRRLLEGVYGFVDWEKVAKLVGRSVNACQIRSCQRKLKKRYTFWNEGRKKELFDMRKKGMTWARIADYFGTSIWATRQAYERYEHDYK